MQGLMSSRSTGWGRGSSTKKKHAKICTSAHQGTNSGLPIHVIWAQSNVRMPIPRPSETPNSWLMTTSCGLIQQMYENVDSAVNK